MMTKTKNTTPEATAEIEEVTFSAKDLAVELGIDAKTFRRWLRTKTTDRANKGGRWVFDAEAKDAFLAAYRKDEVEEPAAEVEPALDA